MKPEKECDSTWELTDEELLAEDVSLEDALYQAYDSTSKLFIVTTIDKTAPTLTVSYVYADTGEAVEDGVTATTRPIRADVTADEPIEGTEGGLSWTFGYGSVYGDSQVITVRDRAGNTASVTAVCPAKVTAPVSAENDPPTATVYLAANLDGESRNLGTFTLYADGETTIYTSGSTPETGTSETVNLNEETVAA